MNCSVEDNLKSISVTSKTVFLKAFAFSVNKFNLRVFGIVGIRQSFYSKVLMIVKAFHVICELLEYKT